MSSRLSVRHKSQMDDFGLVTLFQPNPPYKILTWDKQEAEVLGMFGALSYI